MLRLDELFREFTHPKRHWPEAPRERWEECHKRLGIVVDDWSDAVTKLASA
jgi:hypothetical protein